MGGSILGLLGSLQVPTGALDVFIRTVEVSSYIPGRARLYSKRLVGNGALAREVEARLTAFAEIDAVEALETVAAFFAYWRASKPRLQGWLGSLGFAVASATTPSRGSK